VKILNRRHMGQLSSIGGASTFRPKRLIGDQTRLCGTRGREREKAGTSQLITKCEIGGGVLRRIALRENAWGVFLHAKGERDKPYLAVRRERMAPEDDRREYVMQADKDEVGRRRFLT